MRRLEELALSRLLETLSADEAEEYAALKSRLGNVEAEIESLVALAHLAAMTAAEPPPHTLRAALEKDADEFFGIPQAKIPMPPPPPRNPLRSSAGWWVGLAACVTALVLVHRTSEVQRPTVASVPPVAAPMVPPPSLPSPPGQSPPVQSQRQQQPAAPDGSPVDLAAERRAFLAAHPHLLERAWRAGGDATGAQVSGDVVWDEATQTGYMRFVNLRRNEPNAEQYQLWIFDAERDQNYPVDGGVFDVSARDGEQIIRIHAKLQVHVPLVFAVTVEHPGGVVVSDRSRIAAIANVT